MSHTTLSAGSGVKFAAIALLGALLAATSARADQAINYPELFRLNAIKCVHATVNPDKATVEVLKGPDTVGEITTVRVKAYYDGLIRKNVMEAELMVRKAGSIRQMMIKVLSDSGTAVLGCDLEKTWKDF